ncbi:MAG: TrbI/VirB10 family protein [Acidobacteriota bacterium]
MDDGKLIARIKHENRKREKKNKSKTKNDKYIVLFGCILLFFFTFFLYEVFAEPDTGNKTKKLKTNNKDIIAQINEMEKRKKLREEKESKIADDIFLGENSSISEYADQLIKELKEEKNSKKERIEFISDTNIFESGNIETELSEEETNNIFTELENEEGNSFEFNSGPVDPPKNHLQRMGNSSIADSRRERKNSIIAFSNINRNARVYNNGHEFVIREISGGIKRKERDVDHYKKVKPGKKTPIRLVYNNNPLRMIYEGEFLETVLVNKIINDKNESPVKAVIIKDFFDKRGEYVLLPASTRLIGKAIPITGQQENRLIIKFHRILLPNGESIFFEENNKELLSLNTEGVLGLKGKVNRHLFKKYGAALFFGLMNGISDFAQNRIVQSSGPSFLIGKSSENFKNLNNQTSGDSMLIVPTITLKEGTRMKIFVSTDIEISSYQKVKTRSYFKK